MANIASSLQSNIPVETNHCESKSTKACKKGVFLKPAVLCFSLLFGALLLPITPTESQAQSPHMKQQYNPHKRKMNRGHDNNEKTWEQKRNSNDPRYKKHSSGGNPHIHKARHLANASEGGEWRITSDCASACTTGFAAYPKTRICIADGVKLGFHHGVTADRTAAMWNSYPGDVKTLINRHGGWRPEWTWVPASAFHAVGYKRC